MATESKITDTERDDRQTGVEVQLVGTDGNIFALMGTASRAMKRAGFRDEAAEMTAYVMESGNYDVALSRICEYVEAL